MDSRNSFVKLTVIMSYDLEEQIENRAICNIATTNYVDKRVSRKQTGNCAISALP